MSYFPATNPTGLTTADIPDTTDKRYVTDAMLAGMTPAVVRTIPVGTTTDTLVLDDAFQTVKSSDSSPTTVTVPPNSDVAFAAFDAISLFAGGSGTLVLSPGSGVTLKSAGVTVASLALPAGQGATLVQTSTLDTWDIVAVTKSTLGISGTNTGDETAARLSALGNDCLLNGTDLTDADVTVNPAGDVKSRYVLPQGTYTGPHVITTGTTGTPNLYGSVCYRIEPQTFSVTIRNGGSGGIGAVADYVLAVAAQTTAVDVVCTYDGTNWAVNTVFRVA